MIRNKKKERDFKKWNEVWYKDFYGVCWYNCFRNLFQVWDFVFNPHWNHIHQYHLVE